MAAAAELFMPGSVSALAWPGRVLRLCNVQGLRWRWDREGVGGWGIIDWVVKVRCALAC